MLIMSLVGLCASFDKKQEASITVSVTDLRTEKGFVLISLFDDKASFPKNAEKAVGKAKAIIRNGNATATFSNLQPGTYAVAVLHDENQNLKMDMNSLGLPREGYGFSNKAKGRFGPPDFEKAAFRLHTEDITLRITAEYLLR